MENGLQILLDFPELEAQIGETIRVYTDLGSAIQTLASSTSSAARDVALDAKLAVGALTTPQRELDVSHIENSIRLHGRQEERITANLQRMTGLKLGTILGESVGGLPETRRAPSMPIALPDTADAQRSMEKALKAPERIPLLINEQVKKSAKRNSELAAFIEKETKSVKGGIKSLLSKIPGGVATGFIGGLIGTMVLGYTEKDRRRKEMGEMSNIFESGVDSLLSSGGRRASRWFARWGERAQWHWGVGRKETQRAVQLMVDNGFAAGEMLKKYDKGLGRVGENVVTLALGIGKHYNFATSQSMEHITSLVRDYGMELKQSADFYTKLTAAGARSGIGVRNFTRIVMSASDPLSKMGINAENVAVVVEKVIGFYTDMGLEEQYAGTIAEAVVMDLGTAFTNLDNQMKIVLAREIYQDEESGAAALMIKFDDGLRRIAEGDADEFMARLLGAFIRLVKNKTAVGRSRGIMAVKGLLSVSGRTAQLAWDAGEKFAKGGKLAELEDEKSADLRKAFEREQERVSGLHRTRRELIRGLGYVGEALLAILTDLSALLMVGMKGLGIMATAPKGQLMNAIDLVYSYQSEIYKKMGLDWEHLMKGAGIMGGALGKEFYSTFEPLLLIFNKPFKPFRPPPRFPGVSSGLLSRSDPGARPPVQGARWAGWQWVGPDGKIYDRDGNFTGTVVPGSQDQWNLMMAPSAALSSLMNVGLSVLPEERVAPGERVDARERAISEFIEERIRSVGAPRYTEEGMPTVGAIGSPKIPLKKEGEELGTQEGIPKIPVEKAADAMIRSTAESSINRVPRMNSQ